MRHFRILSHCGTFRPVPSQFENGNKNAGENIRLFLSVVPIGWARAVGRVLVAGAVRRSVACWYGWLVARAGSVCLSVACGSVCSYLAVYCT